MVQPSDFYSYLNTAAQSSWLSRGVSRQSTILLEMSKELKLGYWETNFNLLLIEFLVSGVRAFWCPIQPSATIYYHLYNSGMVTQSLNWLSGHGPLEVLPVWTWRGVVRSPASQL